MERKKSYVQSMEEGVRRTQEGNFAFIGEAVSLDLAVARYCKLTRSQEVIGMRGYAIAAPLGEWLWPVTKFSVVFDQRIAHQWNCSVLLSDLSVQIPVFTMFFELLHLSNKFIMSPFQTCVKFCLFWSNHKWTALSTGFERHHIRQNGSQAVWPPFPVFSLSLPANVSSRC